MAPDLRVGVILKPHGIKGEVKVYSTTETPKRFLEFRKLKLKASADGKTLRELRIENVKFVSGSPVIKLHGIGSMEEAEKLRGLELYIPREEGVALSEGEYYIGDIIGMSCISDEGEPLGTVRDVLETGANDVYVVARKDGGRDLLIPVIPECVLSTDIEAGVLTVHLMDGLLDL